MARMHPTSLNSRGFTLIELLVVIAIIGLLSVVVLAALNTTRGKSEDAAIKSEVVQLATLYNEEFADTGSYVNLWADGGAPTGHWINTTALCSTPASGFTGSYASQAKAICSAIINTEGSASVCPAGWQCIFDDGPLLVYSTQVYSIVAWLPGAQEWICLGSSGQSSISTNLGGGTYNAPGCPGNP